MDARINMGFENLGSTTGTLYKILEDGTYEEVARNVSIDSCLNFDGSEEDDGIDEIVFTLPNLKSCSFTARFGDDVVSEQDAEFVEE